MDGTLGCVLFGMQPGVGTLRVVVSVSVASDHLLVRTAVVLLLISVLACAVARCLHLLAFLRVSSVVAGRVPAVGEVDVLGVLGGGSQATI